MGPVATAVLARLFTSGGGEREGEKEGGRGERRERAIGRTSYAQEGDGRAANDIKHARVPWP